MNSGELTSEQADLQRCAKVPMTRRHLWRTAATLIAVLLSLAFVVNDLPAHGGQYRQPTPGAGARDVVATPATWRTWWDGNKEGYLRRAIAQSNPVTTGSDDFYLGRRRPGPVVDIQAVTREDRLSRIVPALAALMANESGRDVQSACLIALGKVGLDAPGIDLDALLSTRIDRANQEIREAAVLALGITGRTKPVARLLSLIRDEPAGRKLVGKSKVDVRVRTFATYGLALIARRSGDAKLQVKVYQVLSSLLYDTKQKSRDLRVAAVLGIGILRADSSGSAGKMLAWRAVEDLLAWFEKDFGSGEEFLQGQAPISIARLLGRGTSRLHQRCKEVFVKELTKSSHRGNAILHGAAIALGMMSVSEAEHAEDAIVSQALRKAYGRGLEQHVRMFSVIALAQIGGKANRDWLMHAYPKGNKTMEKGWLAIALGVLSADSARRGSVDEQAAVMLLDELVTASHEDLRTPLAIAVGLTGHKPAAPALLRMLADRADNETFAAYLCTSLGLLGDAKSIPGLLKVLESSKRRPFVMQQCAIALGQLGDREISQRLVTMLGANDSVAVLASIAIAIARIGDRRTIDSLIQATKDKDMPTLGRAFAAAALGSVGDKDLLPWNHALSQNANYVDAVDTLTNGSTGVLDIL
tara:strand:+ start:1434 stop:3359 length:1926 start_codon:yes stop_codon:yes gene_type:complete